MWKEIPSSNIKIPNYIAQIPNSNIQIPKNTNSKP